jgi:hypothetical protein
VGALPDAELTPLEPDYAKLPSLDPMTVARSSVKPPPMRGITEVTCQRLASERANATNPLAQEDGVPRVVFAGRRQSPSPSGDGGELLREIRSFALAEGRNRAASEALSSFYQLADANGRSELVRLSLETLDEARKTALEAKLKGAIVDLGELDRERATTLAILGQADLGVKLLDLDLRRRLGITARSGELLRPTGEFSLTTEPVVVDSAIEVALQQRPDLQGLRTVYLKLSPDNLDDVREYLRGLPGTAGMLGLGPRLPLARQAMQRKMEQVGGVLAQAADLEIAVRRQQLFLLIEERERAAADEVRAAAAALNEQTRQVALARWRSEQLMNRANDLRKEKGTLVGLPAMAESLRARGEVISAVMSWHQARVRFNAAQGLYAELPPTSVAASR